MVALGIELSATRLSAEFGQPALDYHVVSIQVGHLGVEPPVVERSTDETLAPAPKAGVLPSAPVSEKLSRL